ncbi:cobalamin-binding protein [Antarcticibacterium flavum]|uniref:Cobalamin-binding protein n=1 Tax=Antarcticibacterium flavum TaxID=2058175 RepID=A0A5B7X0E4_9FLAO|nr:MULTISPECIES: helical backbone metal receptor [Antarcticibacterium]MCM4160723.1 cobalamin-binding protein [Antarcticibacterium sp. W02-3]QCY68799.1 cobalamin-binding protein [Antarcticibacterium flavum]
MIIKDQLQRDVHLGDNLQRIVSLVPSQTELLYDLGLENEIGGITKFCIHPNHLRKNTRIVGGTKQVHFDRIRDLKPDIILCNKEENTKEMVKELEKIAPVHVSDIKTFEDSLELIDQYGRIFNREHLTFRFIEDLKSAKENFQKTLKEGRNLKVAYFIWRDPWMLAGSGTFIDTLLKINKLENVIQANRSRYPTIDLKDLESLRPDVVLLSSEPFPFREKHKKEISKHFEGKIQLVDGEYFSWYGSRLLPAFDYFRKFQMKLSSLR